MPEFTGEIHYVKLAYEISEIQENCCLPWRQESADRMSMVKRELQRRWTWTWLHIRKSVALQPGNMIHMPAIYHLPFSSRLFLDGDPFLPLFHEHLARAWCNILCLRDKPAKSTGGLKNVAADCCAHSTFSASLISVTFIVMTATGVQKMASDQKHFHTTLLEGKGN